MKVNSAINWIAIPSTGTERLRDRQEIKGDFKLENCALNLTLLNITKFKKITILWIALLIIHLSYNQSQFDYCSMCIAPKDFLIK